MKIVIDIQDNKASFLLEVLKNFSFIKKITPITDEKAQLIYSIKSSVNEMQQIKEGKLKGIPANDLLNELINYSGSNV